MSKRWPRPARSAASGWIDARLVGGRSGQPVEAWPVARVVTGVEAPQLPGMSEAEESVADLWATGVSPEGHPIRFLRADLDAQGVVPVNGLRACEDRSRVAVGGVVTHRQRPATASGITFMNLEDETGMINIVVSVGCWTRHRRIARTHRRWWSRACSRLPTAASSTSSPRTRTPGGRRRPEEPRLPVSTPASRRALRQAAER